MNHEEQEKPQLELIRGLDTYNPYYVTKICTINLANKDLDPDTVVDWLEKHHPRRYFGNLYLTTHNSMCWDVALPLSHNNTNYAEEKTGKKVKFNLGRDEKDIEKWLKISKDLGIVTHEFNWRDPNPKSEKIKTKTSKI